MRERTTRKTLDLLAGIINELTGNPTEYWAQSEYSKKITEPIGNPSGIIMFNRSWAGSGSNNSANTGQRMFSPTAPQNDN